jgi:hypothetical protein
MRLVAQQTGCHQPIVRASGHDPRPPQTNGGH